MGADYRRRLDRMVDEMHSSVLFWVRAAYRRDEPATVAEDADPVDRLRRAIRRLVDRWQARFDAAAPALAGHFARSAATRTDASLRRALRSSGMSVRFQFPQGQAAREVVAASVAENVRLIRSIASQHLTAVEGAVMRSVQAGRDLGALSDELRASYGVTRRRAALIARDQNNKASAAIQRVRFLDLGIERAVWMHSHAGREPRPSHVAMDGKEYDVARGMWDRDERRWIMPGELINCRCTSRPVVEGFS